VKVRSLLVFTISWLLTANAVAGVTEAASGAEAMTVWVEKTYSSRANTLHTELKINGQLVDVFSSDTFKPIDKYLQKGENTIIFRTFQRGTEDRRNDLLFRIGPVRRDEKKNQRVMDPVLWQFRNGTDWDFKDGKYIHALDPDAKDVTITYRVYFSSLQHEAKSIQKGDYVLQAKAAYSSWNVPLTATVYVNGQPLNSFMLQERQVVITPLLKQGKNEIKVISRRVKDSLRKNDLTLTVAGPAEYIPAQKQFQVKPIVEARAMTAWRRDERSGQLANKSNPVAEEDEQTLTFTLDEAPTVEGN
jgi:hypothetical protein